MSRDEQSVRDFFYFKERDPVTGADSPSVFGYFKNDTEYARLHTDQRIAMISGNPAELEQWVIWFIYDVWTICMRTTKVIRRQPLLSRLPQIDVPIFLAFGAEEPFIPSTGLNGLDDMANEVITPFLAEHGGRRQPGRRRRSIPGSATSSTPTCRLSSPRTRSTFMKTGRVDQICRRR